MRPDPFNQVYTVPKQEENEKQEKQEFTWKDILALTLAAYEILLLPLGLFGLLILVLVSIIYLLA